MAQGRHDRLAPCVSIQVHNDAACVSGACTDVETLFAVLGEKLVTRRRLHLRPDEVRYNPSGEAVGANYRSVPSVDNHGRCKTFTRLILCY